jgi:hypothetical protein
MGCDVPRSLDFLGSHGSLCGCEILMNVEAVVEMEEDSDASTAS